MTWSFSTEQLDARTDRLRLPLPVSDVVALWRTSEPFARAWTAALAGSRFAAMFWECPPLARATATREFECVLVDAPGLDAPPDRAAFADHFDDHEAVAFPNLGGDAVLVVPCPRAGSYAHLAAFVRSAPDQAVALWRHVGDAVERRLSDRPLWLSTAGMGVAWLHVRLDDRPKYYRHAAYKR